MTEEGAKYKYATRRRRVVDNDYCNAWQNLAIADQEIAQAMAVMSEKVKTDQEYNLRIIGLLSCAIQRMKESSAIINSD